MKFIKQYSTLIFLLVAGVLFLLAYHFAPEPQEVQNQRVVDSNEIRKVNRVPVIEQDWIKESTQPGKEKWYDGIRGINSSKPVHLYKEVSYTGDIVQLERDAFHFEFSDTVQYRLIIYHECAPDYKTIKRIKNDMVIYHLEEFPPSHSESLSNHAADSVLQAWNINI